MFIRTSVRSIIGACGLLLLGGLPEASAQVAAMVNEEPVSNYDVSQRLNLLKATGQNSSRKKVLEDLIKERIKFQEARKLKVTVEEADVNRIFGSIAQRVKMSPGQLTQALKQLGANSDTLKTRIRADLAWREVVKRKLRSEVQVQEADILAALKKKNQGQGRITQYELSQIIYVIPKRGGTSAASRRRAAENMRARFVSCAQTLPKVRGLRDVVVKRLGVKRSDELSADIREKLASTGKNEVTRPNVTKTGVELIAVCDKRVVADDTAGKKRLRKEMLNEGMKEGAEKLMAELRQDAYVEFR